MISNITAKSISASYEHSLIIDINNKVWSFGNNNYGQLGLGDHGKNTNKDKPTMIHNITAKAISTGGNHSLIIDMNDKVWSFGRNYFGQLGLGDHGFGTDRDRPTMISNITAKSIVSKGDHTLLISY